jgi:hypothetical protein
MNGRLNIDIARMGNKWVACFDLLGFSDLTNRSLLHAVDQVQRCLPELNWVPPVSVE